MSGRLVWGKLLELAGLSTLACTPSLTTLTHVTVGEAREVAGQGEVSDSWRSAGPAASPTTPEEGEARQAWRFDRHPAALLHPPAPVGGGGETGSGAGVRMQERSSSPDEG